MKAILIVPSVQRVEEIDLDMSYQALSEAVGGPLEIAHVYENGDTLYVHEEGLLEHREIMAGRLPAGENAFAFELGLHQPFFGKGVIVGPEDAEGRHTAARTDIQEIRETISFLSPGAMAAKPGPSGGN